MAACSKKNETVEIDEYRGSDSFYIEVNHGPIQGMTDDAPIDGAALNSIIVVPSSTDALADSGGVLALISIGEGVDTICDDCRVRLGVVTGDTRRAEDDEDAVDLPGRISVLGISYEGSERINIGDALSDAQTFQGTLDFDPVNVAGTNVNDDGDHIIDGHDIKVVRHSLGTGETITIESVDGRIVKFMSSTKDTDSDDTVDVAYAIRAGGDPRNALLPNMNPRPIIAVSAGSRVTITSGNDRVTVDAEVDPPTFSNPSPAQTGATDDKRQVISVDITDDLAGVNKKSVALTVTVRNTTYMVANKDLTFNDIGGGVSVSIALDDVEDETSERSPRIDADEDTVIRWQVTASDNAGNRATSDAVADEDGKDETQDDQPYTFNVDGQKAALDKAYTGDWFDTVDERVEGDRFLGADKYLEGASRSHECARSVRRTAGRSHRLRRRLHRRWLHTPRRQIGTVRATPALKKTISRRACS